MSYQSDATYSDGSIVSPTDSEKHILGQIAKNTQGASSGGSGGDASAANQLAGIYGATNLVTSQVTSGAAATLVAARPTRRSVFIRNNGTSTDEVAVGEATVTTTKGTRLKAGEGLSFTFIGLIQVLAITGTPIVTAADEFN